MSQILHNAPLYYPSAREWMWDYCIYLGPYTCPDGHKYDLGIYIGNDEMSAAIVFGNRPGDYSSGPITSTSPEYVETIRRAKLLELMK